MLEGNGLGLAALKIPGAAEIHQLESSVFQLHQVVRADVPVDDPHLVHRLHGPEHRAQPREQVRSGDRAVLGSQFLQGLPLQKLHDDIGGVVLRKMVLHPDDLRDLVQLRHGLGLPEELLPAFLIGGLVSRGVAGHIQGDRDLPAHQEGGEVLFDGHPLVQHRVPAQIGDAEAALSQDASHPVAPVQKAAGRNMMAGGLVGLPVLPAGRAGCPGVYRRQAVGAKAFHLIHLASLPLRGGQPP